MSPPLCYLAVALAIAGGLMSAEADQNITAQPKEDVTLRCQDLNEKKITVLEWGRTDLDPWHVIFFREGLFESDYQHPSFKNRVDLLDSQMKDGDTSVILKNVTINDTGTYEFRVMQREGDHGTNNMELICTLHLEVAPPVAHPGSKDGGDEDGGDEDGGDEEQGGEKQGDEDGGEGTSFGLFAPFLGLILLVVILYFYAFCSKWLIGGRDLCQILSRFILCVGALCPVRLVGGRHPPTPEPAAVPQVEAPLMMDPPGPPAEAETPV